MGGVSKQPQSRPDRHSVCWAGPEERLPGCATNPFYPLTSRSYVSERGRKKPPPFPLPWVPGVISETPLTCRAPPTPLPCFSLAAALQPAAKEEASRPQPGPPPVPLHESSFNPAMVPFEKKKRWSGEMLPPVILLRVKMVCVYHARSAHDFICPRGSLSGLGRTGSAGRSVWPRAPASLQPADLKVAEAEKRWARQRGCSAPFPAICSRLEMLLGHSGRMHRGSDC